METYYYCTTYIIVYFATTVLNMTDVRSLLRNERAARRLVHPYASYTKSGVLSCSLCAISIKSEGLWDKHLRSTEHSTRLQQLQTANANKKRKADENDTQQRKKPRNNELESEDESDPVDGATSTTATLIGEAPDQPIPSEHIPSPHTDTALSAPTTALIEAIDEDEWAAFERDVATPPPDPPKMPLSSAVVISAAPLSAAELAAQAREAQSAQKGRRETEAEEEKEEASRRLEDELDEMTALEDRVKRLKEKREALRQAALEYPRAVEPLLPNVISNEAELEETQDRSETDEAEDEEEEGEDDWDLWR